MVPQLIQENIEGSIFTLSSQQAEMVLALAAVLSPNGIDSGAQRKGSRLKSKIQYYVHSEADRRLNCREVSAICVTEVQGVTECQSGGQCSDGKLYFCWMSSLNIRAVMPTENWYLPNDKCNSLARKFKESMSITNYVKTNIFFLYQICSDYM